MPGLSASSGTDLSTLPNTFTPSGNSATASAYGTSFSKPAGANIAFVKVIIVPGPLIENQSMSEVRHALQSLRGGKYLAPQLLQTVPRISLFFRNSTNCSAFVAPVKLITPNCSNPILFLQSA